MKSELSTTGAGTSSASTARSTEDSRRRWRSLQLAASGLTLLVTAQFQPWAHVTISPDTVDQLLGQGSSETVATYRLAELSAAQIPLYVGWTVLLALLVVAWVRPSWSRRLATGSGLVIVVLIFVTAGSVQAAMQTEAWWASHSPSGEFSRGSMLALLGAFLVCLAVAALAVPVRVRDESQPAVPAVTDPEPAQEPVTAELLDPKPTQPRQPSAEAHPGPEAAQPERPRPVGRWSERPVWVPWWRRRGPVTGLAVSTVAVLLLVGAVVWASLSRPAPPRGHSGDLQAFLLTGPAGSRPIQQSTHELDPEATAQNSDDPLASILTLGNEGFRRAITGGWTTSDGTTVVIELIQLDSEESATWFLSRYSLAAQANFDDSTFVDVPGLPGARSFAVPVKTADRTGVAQAFARRGDIVLLIARTQAPPLDPDSINSLVREQYERL